MRSFRCALLVLPSPLPVDLLSKHRVVAPTRFVLRTPTSPLHFPARYVPSIQSFLFDNEREHAVELRYRPNQRSYTRRGEASGPRHVVLTRAARPAAPRRRQPGRLSRSAPRNRGPRAPLALHPLRPRGAWLFGAWCAARVARGAQGRRTAREHHGRPECGVRRHGRGRDARRDGAAYGRTGSRASTLRAEQLLLRRVLHESDSSVVSFPSSLSFYSDLLRCGGFVVMNGACSSGWCVPENSSFERYAVSPYALPHRPIDHICPPLRT